MSEATATIRRSGKRAASSKAFPVAGAISQTGRRKAAQEGPRRHVVDLRDRDFRPAADPRALQAVNPGEGGAS